MISRNGANSLLSIPDQYSPEVCRLNLPQFSVAAGLPGRAPEDRRRVITDTALVDVACWPTNCDAFAGLRQPCERIDTVHLDVKASVATVATSDCRNVLGRAP